MLIELSVRNFGPIKETQTLSMIARADDTLEDYYIVKVDGLRLLKLAVLYGPNASGKTTFIKALQFLRRILSKPAADKSALLEFRPFEFDPEWRSAGSTIRLAFLAGGVRHVYEVAFYQEYILKETMLYYPKGREATLFTRTTDPKKELTLVRFGSTPEIKKRDEILLEGNTIWNTTVMGAFAITNVDVPELQRIKDWFNDNLMPCVLPSTKLTAWATGRLQEEPDLKKMVTAFLNKADVQISDLTIEQKYKELQGEEREQFVNIVKTLTSTSSNLPNENEPLRVKQTQLTFEHSVYDAANALQKYLLEAEEQSAGTMRYFGLSTVLAILMTQSRVLAIDEIETSLHPDLMKHFILTFLANAKDSQLILTTHNLSFLEERDILRNDAVWFTQKGADGATELYSAGDFDSSVLRKSGSLINAYRIGKLGAKPSLGNIFLEQNG